jgi:hypothetical protein
VKKALDIYKAFNPNNEAEPIFPAPVPGSESDWSVVLTEGIPAGFAQEWAKFWLKVPGYNGWEEYEGKKADILSMSLSDKYAKDAEAAQFNLGPDFKGKIILYHGIADGLIPVGSSTRYYEKTKAAYGESKTKEFMRYFQIPGMHHCFGTEDEVASNSGVATKAPWMIGAPSQNTFLANFYGNFDGFSVPSHTDQDREQFDAMAKLINWVEKGTEVSEITATSWNIVRRGAALSLGSVFKTAKLRPA